MMLFAKSNSIVCNSHATLSDVERLFKGNRSMKRVIYPPLPDTVEKSALVREKRFIMVSGPYHKNAANAIRAFEFFKQKHPGFTFSIYGECSPEELKTGITIEPMKRYNQALATSSGLIFCSFHEGLGLPPLEAMSLGCPMVLSDLPVLHETCGDAGFYADPRNITSITQGMEELAHNQDFWTQKSFNGGVRYRGMSNNAGKEWLTLYNDLA
jgi:Glycosyltransferase